MSLAVTEVPTPEQFHTVTREGAERASQPLPGDGLPTAAQESSRLFASHSQASRSITFCCHLTCYFGRSTAPLMGSISAVHRGKGPAFPRHPEQEEKGRALETQQPLQDFTARAAPPRDENAPVISRELSSNTNFPSGPSLFLQTLRTRPPPQGVVLPPDSGAQTTRTRD